MRHLIWQYNSYFPLMLLAGTISLGVALFTLRRRPAPSSAALGVVSLAGAAWAWFTALQLVSGDLESAVVFHKLEFIGMDVLGVAWFAFAAVYTGHERWATAKRLVMLSLVPVATQVLVWTSGHHALIWKALTLDATQYPAVLRETPGPWWWVDTVYSYCLAGIGIFLLASMLLREPGIYRRQVVALLAGGIVPLVVDATYTYSLPEAVPVNLAPALFAWVGVALYWGFTRYQLLDVAPAAREFVVKHMSDSLIVTDTGDRVVYLNPAAEKLIGAELGSAAGKPIAEVMSVCLGLLEARDDGGDGLVERAQEREYGGRFYDGRVSTLLNGRDHVRGSILVLRDSTDRRKAELALEEAHRELDARVQARTAELSKAYEELSGSRARLAHLLHSSPAVIYSCEPADLSRITFVSENLESQLGYKMDQVLGNADFFAGHLHPEDAHFLTSRAEVLTTGQASYEYRLFAPDGTYHWIHDEVRLARDSEERPVELIGSWLDVTDRRRIEERLGHSSRMEAVGLLAGGIAHDFNNLLTAIGGYAELVQVGLAEDAPTRDHMAEIRRAVDRAAGLTGQLLAFSRKQVLKPRVISLNDVIRSMEEMLRRLIGENIEFSTDLAPDLGVVRADPGQIEQVCMNLIVNARDAMPQGGRLIVQTTNLEITPQASGMFEDAPPGSYAALSISDTGQGIEDEFIPHLFEPFFTTKGDKGTGLGLATVYGIVGQSGGRVTVESTVGRGTTFVVLLPSVQDEIEEAVSVAPVSAERPSGSEKLLVVEDEPAVRTLVTTALRRYGFRVLEADGAMAALELARRHGPPDLLIADVAMPVTSGPELADQLRETCPELRVLYISGYPWDKLNEAWRVSNVALLAKPFTMNDLVTAVREALL
jgi:PAS domain S-box-containing protein